ncbi:MAG: ribonuclease HII [Spirochaetes bacterium]|nr:ribonuclease HII [Spirochaetota bacterium]
MILGIDEAGRGPLAGPVYAAAVILNPHKPIPELNDSKKLSEKHRKSLYEQIINQAQAYAITYCTPEEIDELNILKATFWAMKKAITQIEDQFEYILIDGNIYPFSSEYPGAAIVKGDSKIPEIMAASILAKVARDRFMISQHDLYPQYQFQQHKGYPTKAHRQLIEKHGPCPIHRKSFKGVKEHLPDFYLWNEN